MHLTTSKTKQAGVVRILLETWRELLVFISNPTDCKAPIQTLAHKTKRLFSVLVIDIFSLIVVLPVLYGIEGAGLINTESKVEDFFYQVPTGFLIALVVVIIPLFEELAFRLWLRLEQNYLLWPVKIVVSLTGQNNLQRYKSFISQKWHKYYRVIVYLSVTAFALLHITNYDYTDSWLIFIPILVMPQFIIGFLISYLRVKYGFLWGFYLHALNNLLVVLLFLMFASEVIERATITNESYQLRVEEVLKKNLEAEITIYPDSVKYQNIALKELLAKLLHQERNLIEFNPEDGWEELLNVSFKAYADSLLTEAIILDELQRIYSFTLNRDTLLVPTYQLRVVDSTLLARSGSQSSTKSSRIDIKATDTTVNSGARNDTIYQTQLTLTNVSLAQLVENLNLQYDVLVTTEIPLEQRFDFEFRKEKIDQLSRTLSERYGLALQKSETKVEQVEVIRQ